MTEQGTFSKNPFSLEGKTVLITGSTSGIGKKTAQFLALAGARIICVARRQNELDLVLSSLVGEGHLSFSFDLNATDDIPEFIKTVAGPLGGLDGIVHAAGLHGATPVKALKSAEMRDLYSLNVVAGAMLAKGLRQKSIHKTGSNIVFLASAVGLVGGKGLSSYSASKGAVITLTKSLAMELSTDGIRVNCVCPGVVETPMTDRLKNQIGDYAFNIIESDHPLGIGTTDDVALAVQFLMSGAAQWITGVALPVDGGYVAR